MPVERCLASASSLQQLGQGGEPWTFGCPSTGLHSISGLTLSGNQHGKGSSDGRQSDDNEPAEMVVSVSVTEPGPAANITFHYRNT